MSPEWSGYQTAIFEAVLDHEGDMVVLARAGTGKTTTMVEAAIRWGQRHPRTSVLMTAFNKRNATELEQRLRDAGLTWRQAQAKTLHSVGFATVRRSSIDDVSVDADKSRKIARKLAADHLKMSPHDSEVRTLAGEIGKLAGIAKGTLTDPRDGRAMTELLWEFVPDCSVMPRDLITLAGEAMAMAEAASTCVDFDDMVWFPHVFGMKPWQHDLVIVDEAQDMNASQLELARKSVKRGGRLVAVGDDRQAIYGWRGADSGFLPRMIDELGARVLPLPRTYRCGHAIVAEAQRFVPDYEAAPSNPEGVVRGARRGDMLGAAAPGDFVLSRTNAPLIGMALGFIREGRPAQIQGRDIVEGLAALAKRSKREDTAGLLDWLATYEVRECARLTREDAREETIESVRDRCACLRVVAAQTETVEDAIGLLRSLFGDKDDDELITLSTVHRAKGLERDRVWLLEDTFKLEGDQEANVRYVAITRARHELVYVRGE